MRQAAEGQGQQGRVGQLEQHHADGEHMQWRVGEDPPERVLTLMRRTERLVPALGVKVVRRPDQQQGTQGRQDQNGGEDED